MAAFNSTNRTGSRYSCSNVGRESKPKTATSTSEENPCNSHKTSWSKRLEIYLLTGIILVVSFLFVTPTILYALPPLSGTQAPDDSHDKKPAMNQCDKWNNYTGDICFDEFRSLQSCFGAHASVSQSDEIALRIPSDIDQEKAEAGIKRLLHGLPLLSPSPECESAIKPFSCLYLFGSCDANGNLHQALQAECISLREEVCAKEWALAEKLLRQSALRLPDCGSLHDKEDKCQGFNGSLSSHDETAYHVINLSSVNITCAEGYYLSESGVCRPLCSHWVGSAEIKSDYVFIAAIASALIGLVSSTILIIIAFTLQRKTLLIFPTYYLVYLCMTAFVIALLIVVGLASEGRLFCSSSDLFETFMKETAYCTFSGIVFTYGLAQLGVFVLYHAVGLCWGIMFPFHHRRFKVEEKLKYVHITTVIIALFLPAVPALLHLERGYAVASTPTSVCFGRSVDVTFFSLILPLSIIFAISTSILVIMFWTIFKKLILKRSTFTSQGREAAGVMKKAEAKILFIMCYYILLGTLVLTLYTTFEANIDVEYRTIEQYFACQSTGLQFGKDCGVNPQGPLTSLSVVAVVLTGLLPLVVITFTVRCNCKRQASKHDK